MNTQATHPQLFLEATEAASSLPEETPARPVVELSDIRAWRFFQAAPEDFLEQYADEFTISDAHLSEEFFPRAVDFLARRQQRTLHVRARLSRNRLLEIVQTALAQGVTSRCTQFASPRALSAQCSDSSDITLIAPRFSFSRAVDLLGAGPESDSERFSAAAWTQFFKRLWYLDLAGSLRLRDRSSFFSFMKALASRTAQGLNWADIAAEVGVSAPTVRDWTRHLEQIGLCELIGALRAAPPRRAKLRPKLYWTAPGLALWLSDSMTKPPEAFIAALLENAVYLALKDALPQAQFLHFVDTNRITAPLIIANNVRLDHIDTPAHPSGEGHDKEKSLPDAPATAPNAPKALYFACDDRTQTEALKAHKSLARAGLTSLKAHILHWDPADLSRLEIETISVS